MIVFGSSIRLKGRAVAPRVLRGARTAFPALRLPGRC
jgi:hypothetical protein